MVSVSYVPTSAPPVVAVLDTTIFARNVFRNRTTNRRLRRDFAFVTSARQEAEATRHRYRIPPFVQVWRVSERQQDAVRRDPENRLSPADLALNQLAEDFQRAGTRAILVSDDDALRSYTLVESWTGCEFVERAHRRFA